ncbi:hypothetical protein HBI56_059940 [Parastagonospora nodorum]|uniref:Uncharacterized protein n=2 Tax=Phaeosphaeria nodorum (strain SN15 / ATCC MYA-4574 / FGSC 10173) TaxID=321614 RepID=A0A7U2F497_PHANO|nr:hypothetical protein SNOG_08853 [Parastagonospora nodorum SN15]KAH3909601.1 hypothetical protein HBH56_158670 [Parastagonospora nodorum]EAT84021.1 hypothetical protein SNOG_08853 [Parastagonospora nodorum SN15]KAH3922495.1 hypothetical protein HBH54_223100 [Parastagonospora nodorum]KAH3946811.1 hypothetical protein HBH53_123240 [Parastagonospora nodorum]KAH3969587.1 hypothetical protein HBH52_171250 [Parastagonospora nodorum]
MSPKKIKDLDVEKGDKVPGRVRQLASRISNVSVFSLAPVGATSTLPQRPKSHQRFANEPLEGFSATRLDHRQRRPREPAIGLAAHRRLPQPPRQLYSLPASHPPVPSAPKPTPIIPNVRHGPKFPCIEWVEERENSIKSTARRGVAAYYHRSYQFRSIKRKREEQVPGGKRDTEIKPTEQRPDKLVMILGLTNVRRANAQTKVNARLQKTNKRS